MHSTYKRYKCVNMCVYICTYVATKPSKGNHCYQFLEYPSQILGHFYYREVKHYTNKTGNLYSVSIHFASW